MKRLIAIIVFMHVFATGYSQRTYCNPLNLDYRYSLNRPSRREAADPTMVVFKNEYYLFASKSGGYWHSKDLLNWDLITTKDLPLEDYAPTTVVVILILPGCLARHLLLVCRAMIPNTLKRQLV